MTVTTKKSSWRTHWIGSRDRRTKNQRSRRTLNFSRNYRMKISKTKGTLNIFTWPSYKILNIQSSRVWLSRITSHNIKPNSIRAHIRLSIIKHYNFPFPVSSFSKTCPFSVFLVQVYYPFHTLYQLKPFLLSIYRKYSYSPHEFF